ncbi:zinc finger protein [Crotalus adamanteus]|uniref:Zinc finger protein n=1 Tax=Crotalus adamanteus TaxID=8729 RepID=A0AAW1BTL9_CROAD
MEEGALVDAEEKALHQEVMLENARNMASLGGDVKIEGSSQAMATPFLTVKKEDVEKMSEKERLGGKEELKKYSSFQCADIASLLHSDDPQEKGACPGIKSRGAPSCKSLLFAQLSRKQPSGWRRSRAELGEKSLRRENSSVPCSPQNLAETLPGREARLPGCSCAAGLGRRSADPRPARLSFGDRGLGPQGPARGKLRPAKDPTSPCDSSLPLDETLPKGPGLLKKRLWGGKTTPLEYKVERSGNL